jgi:hypothetical protein
LTESELKDQAKETPETTAACPAPGENEAAAQTAAGTEPISKAPEPVAIGNEQIAILKHDIYRKCQEDGVEEIGISMTVKNQSGEAFGSVSFEAQLFNIDGNVIDTIKHKEFDIPVTYNRTVRIISKSPEADKVKSYAVKIDKVISTPKPVAEGNDKVVILKHNLTASDAEQRASSGVEVAIRNVSKVTAATLTFDVKFLDLEGNVTETVKHNEADLRPETSRAMMINNPGPESGYKTKSYSVRLIRMTTADDERVQLRRNEIKTNAAGEEEIEGIAKNISTVKTDAALVANFFDAAKENIGTRVLVLKDIEPESIRRFEFKFKPQPGDKVISYTLAIGEITENLKQ